MSAILLWACVLCGERLDETIRFHRAFHREETIAQRNERILREAKIELAKLELTMLGAAS